MFPIKDYNPIHHRPFLTYLLLGVNVLVFLWQLSLSDPELAQAYRQYTVVPFVLSRDIFSTETLLDSLRSMFLHGSWSHLIFNMLFLWVFGDNLEDRLGKPLFLLFYLTCGLVAVFAQVLINPDSRSPMVGASGAIAGILGGYIVLFPSARVNNFVFLGFFFFFVDLPAVVVLGLWFVMQLFSGVASLGVETAGGGTAFFAHIGGFLAGAALIALHRSLAGAPPVEEPPTIHMRERPPSVDVNPNRFMARQVMPITGLTIEQRDTRRGANYLALLDWGTTDPVWLLADERTYYGRILKLEAERVLLKESDGMLYNVPLENILRVG
jgi:membrane associated rhomboid family serine protease